MSTDKYFMVLFGKEERPGFGGWYEREREFKTLRAAIKWAIYIDDTWGGLEVRPVVIGAPTKVTLDWKRISFWKNRGTKKEPKLLWDADEDQ